MGTWEGLWASLALASHGSLKTANPADPQFLTGGGDGKHQGRERGKL